MITEKFDRFVYKYLEELNFGPNARHSTNIVDRRGERDMPHVDPPRNPDGSFHEPETTKQWNSYVDRLKAHNVARDASPVPKTGQQHIDDIGKEWGQQTEPIDH